MDDGLVRIITERNRVRSEEGYTEEHDDMHIHGELAHAAACYALLAARQQSNPEMFTNPMSKLRILGVRQNLLWWPWDYKYWKPSDDPIRNLEKAGQLIAAEIDRLIRLRDKNA